MHFLYLLLWLPAAAGLTRGARGLLPFELHPELVPAFMLACCLLTVFLPWQVNVALAMVFALSWIYTKMNIRLGGFDPFIYPHVPWREWLHLEKHTEYVYQAGRVSGDLDDIAQHFQGHAEEPVEDTPLPAPKRASYVPEL